MREILFRGMRVDGGEWVEGDLIHCLGHCYIQNIGNPPKDTEYQGPVQVVPETVGQYIGHKDIHKNKIFNGDILRFKEFEMAVDAYEYEYYEVTVKWEDDGWYFEGNRHGGRPDEYSECELELTGSINDKEKPDESK